MRQIPIAVADATTGAAVDSGAGCGSGESFALMVLGESMRPEFDHGDIVIIEPEGLARDGSFVLAYWADQWLLRRLARGTAGWLLQALNPSPAQAIDADIALPDLSALRGVVIQKSRPGRRRATRRYVE